MGEWLSDSDELGVFVEDVGNCEFTAEDLSTIPVASESFFHALFFLLLRCLDLFFGFEFDVGQLHIDCIEPQRSVLVLHAIDLSTNPLTLGRELVIQAASQQQWHAVNLGSRFQPRGHVDVG